MVKAGREHWGFHGPWMNLLLVSKCKFKEDQFIRHLSTCCSSSPLHGSVSCEFKESIKSVTWNTANAEWLGARWAGGLSVSDANLLGLIGASWLDENALLMLRLRGQTGWTFRNHTKATGIHSQSWGLQSQLNNYTTCKVYSLEFWLEVMKWCKMVIIYHHMNNSSYLFCVSAIWLLCIVLTYIQHPGQCLTARWPRPSAGVNLELWITLQTDCGRELPKHLCRCSGMHCDRIQHTSESKMHRRPPCKRSAGGPETASGCKSPTGGWRRACESSSRLSGRGAVLAKASRTTDCISYTIIFVIMCNTSFLKIKLTQKFQCLRVVGYLLMVRLTQKDQAWMDGVNHA